MALTCICISRNGELPSSMADFLNSARFLEAKGTFHSVKMALPALTEEQADYLLLPMEIASKELESLSEEDFHHLKVLIFSKTEIFLMERLPSNLRGTMFAEMGLLVPEGVTGTGLWLRLNDSADMYSSRNTSMFVKADSKIVRLELEQICFVEAQKDYVVFHLESEQIRVLSRMKNVAQKLGEKDFIRIHRSYLIRRDRIRSIEGELVFMRGTNESVPIGPSYKSKLIKSLELM